MKKDIIDPTILSAGNTKYFQANIHDYEVAEYNLDSDVGELSINTSGAAYILPSGVKIVIPNEISCDMNKIYCYVSKESNKFKLNPTDQLLSSIVELTPNGSKFAKPLRISIPYRYTACDKQIREIVMRVTTACTDDFLKYEDLNCELINTMEEDANSFSGEVVSFVSHFSPFAVISRLKEDHVVVENEQPTDIVSSVGSFTKLHFPRSSVVEPTDVTITVLKIDETDVKKIVTSDHCPVSNLLQVNVSPKNTVFQTPVTVFLELPNSLIGDSSDKKMLRLLKSSNESEDWRDITAKVELEYTNENVSFQVHSFSKFCLVGKDLKIDDLRKVIQRTITYEVQFLAMQQKTCPSLVLAQCVRRDLIEKRINKLREEEYYGNHPYTSVHNFEEGQKFKVKVIGGIKVKSSNKDEEKHLEENILIKKFHCQYAPDESGICQFYVEPSEAASKISTGFISFYKVLETVCHAPESDEMHENGNNTEENHLSKNYRHMDDVPIMLKSVLELSEVASSESETVVVSGTSLCDIASEIGAEWEELAIRLGMTLADIDHIKSDHSGQTRQQIIAMLQKWLGRHSHDSEPVTKLVKALEDMNQKATAKKIKNKMEKKSSEMQ